MTFKEITEIIKLVNKSNLTEFKVKNGDFSLNIRTKKYGKMIANQQQQQMPQQQLIPIANPMTTAVQQPVIAPTPAPEKGSNGSSDSKDSKEGKEAKADLLEIKSPMVGTFYRAPEPGKPSYVNVGDYVEKGTVVAIVEAMKLFNEIESEVSGRIVDVLAEDASPVEYDQVMYLVDPKG